MEKLIFIIFIIMSVIIFILIYNVYDLTAKISRLQRRYNTLVKGRGEIDLEELLRSHAADIANANILVNDMQKVTDRLNEDYGNTAKNIDDKIDSEINEVKNVFTQLYDSLNNKFGSEISNLDNKFTGKLRIQQEEMKADMAKVEEDIKRSMNLLNDQLSFAIQKVGFNKYDAFENQTGKLSFTIVLLDRFSNGVMITSINGREDNYNYSKAIKNGDAEFEISPEEKVALDMALRKK